MTRHLFPALALAGLTACAPVQPIIDHDAPRCRKCGGLMVPGIATGQTYKPGSPDFPGDTEASTFSAGGSGVLVGCTKCEDCGWSVRS